MDGYHFVNWIVDGSQETFGSNPLAVTNVLADMTITAWFGPNPMVQVDIQYDSEGGSPGTGDEVPFTVDVSNVGNGNATDVRVLMPLPANTEFVSGAVETVSIARSVTGQVTLEGDNIVITLPSLYVGETIVVHLVLRAIEAAIS